MHEPSTYRPFVYTVAEDDGMNVTIEVSEEENAQVLCSYHNASKGGR
ncbi:MAG: hypothetical protein H0U60_16405 [Blastocatellia bacterium]|nr:hypothetical protein [Blastocatellia bacterium]